MVPNTPYRAILSYGKVDLIAVQNRCVSERKFAHSAKFGAINACTSLNYFLPTSSEQLVSDSAILAFQTNDYTMIINEHLSHRCVHTNLKETHYMYVYYVYLT